MKCGGSYIDSPDWIKNKKRAKKQKNKTTTTSSLNDGKCFQYATTIALNHEETGNKSQRISKIKPFVNKYNYEGINYL